jgi:hypothetical protein
MKYSTVKVRAWRRAQLRKRIKHDPRLTPPKKVALMALIDQGILDRFYFDIKPHKGTRKRRASVKTLGPILEGQILPE